MEDVEDVVSLLLSDRSISRMHHIVILYRLSDPFQENYFDPECDGTGSTLLFLLQRMNVLNVVVLAARWYGGVLLYSDRFKHFTAVANSALHAGPFAAEGEKLKAESKIEEKEKKKAKEKTPPE